MAQDFYPFVGQDEQDSPERPVVCAARIAVYDNPATTPRVVLVEPTGVRSYLDEITQQTFSLAKEQGGTIPFTIIREIVENLIHAAFKEPSISILDGGNTIRFADQGPGIADKERALEFGTTTATNEMKRYIRGVGSGLPIALQWLLDNGGELSVSDNLSSGTIVTISAHTQSSLSPNKSNGRVQAAPEQKLTAREQLVFNYLKTHDVVGPSELSATDGASLPTWSRELKSLEDRGFLQKQGQKRCLTERGKALLATLS